MKVSGIEYKYALSDELKNECAPLSPRLRIKCSGAIVQRHDPGVPAISLTPNFSWGLMPAAPETVLTVSCLRPRRAKIILRDVPPFLLARLAASRLEYAGAQTAFHQIGRREAFWIPD